MGRDISLDEVIEHFTLDGDEKELLRNKAGGRLGFAMMLKYLLWRGRFPRGRHEIPDDAIAHVARQIGVSAGDMGFYDVASRQARNHRAEIRGHTGFRVCTVADADKLALWLAGGVARDGRSAAELGVRQRPVFVREADPEVQLGVARQPAVQARHPNKHKADASTVVVVAQQFQADGLDPVGLVHDEQLGVVAGALRRAAQAAGVTLGKYWGLGDGLYLRRSGFRSLGSLAPAGSRAWSRSRIRCRLR